MKETRMCFYFRMAGFGLALSLFAILDGFATSAFSTKSDSVVFVQFNFSKKKKTEGYAVALLQKIVKPGKLKNHIQTGFPQPNSLACVLKHKSNLKSDTVWIDHPLQKNIEYTDQDKNLKRKQIKVDSSSFFIRFQKLDFEQIVILENVQQKNV